ncbi:MAG: hypothetical protein HRT88_21740 [Lentisphaeraceae bacterium]|nr:hypothetical protein [Lentisphaeraceae bacterium]
MNKKFKKIMALLTVLFSVGLVGHSVYAGCNSADGISITLDVDVTADETTVDADESVTFTYSVTSKTLDHKIDWVIKDSDGEEVTTGSADDSNTDYSYTFDIPGVYTAEYTLNAAPYVDPVTGNTDAQDTCQLTGTITINVDGYLKVRYKRDVGTDGQTPADRAILWAVIPNHHDYNIHEMKDGIKIGESSTGFFADSFAWAIASFLLNTWNEVDGTVKDSSTTKGSVVYSKEAISKDEYDTRKSNNDSLIDVKFPDCYNLAGDNCVGYAANMYDHNEHRLE